MTSSLLRRPPLRPSVDGHGREVNHFDLVIATDGGTGRLKYGQESWFSLINPFKSINTINHVINESSYQNYFLVRNITGAKSNFVLIQLGFELTGKRQTDKHTDIFVYIIVEIT